MLWLGGSADLLAQSAQVSGRVVDASQGSVPGASVTAVSEATGLQRTGVSNSEGYYAIPVAASRPLPLDGRAVRLCTGDTHGPGSGCGAERTR